MQLCIRNCYAQGDSLYYTIFREYYRVIINVVENR